MTQPKPPRIGKPLELTPADLDMAAIVTPVDVAMARQLWQHAAPPVLVALLDAVMED